MVRNRDIGNGYGNCNLEVGLGLRGFRQATKFVGIILIIGLHRPQFAQKKSYLVYTVTELTECLL